MLIDRRNFLGALALTTACTTRRVQIKSPAMPFATRTLARVNISPDRVIRTVVGLRPSAGFTPTRVTAAAARLLVLLDEASRAS